MESNAQLIDYLKACSLIKSKAVEIAFEKVDRKEFVPREHALHAYEDSPLPTMGAQTISAPSIVAIMSEALEVRQGMKVLEVGAGSGYQAAVLAQVVGEKGKIYSIERVSLLCEFARNNLERAGVKRVEVICGDGSKGLLEKAPFDRIIVTAAAKKIPRPLVEQLKPGGRLLIPIGESPYFQELVLVEKTRGGKIVEKPILPVVFVPLVGEHAE